MLFLRHFYLITHQLLVYFEYLNYKNSDFLIAEKASNEVMSIPMNPYLTDGQIDYIILNIKKNIL